MKNNSKSIRMSDKVYNYILSYPGNGFNEKFENIILSAMESETERVENLRRLDDQIDYKRAQISKLNNELGFLWNLKHSLSRVEALNAEISRSINDFTSGGDV